MRLSDPLGREWPHRHPPIRCAAVGSSAAPRSERSATKAHLEIDDRDACLARRGQDGGGGANGSLNHGNINAKPVEHAARGAKVILHVDDEQRTPCRIDGDWLRLRIES